MGSARDLLKAAESMGWEARRTRGGHVSLRKQGVNEIVVASGTPSDHRSALNTISQMRRAEREGDLGRKIREAALLEPFEQSESNGGFCHTATCRACGKKDHVRTSNPQLRAGMVAFRLRQRGWEVEESRSRDRCPTCVRRGKDDRTTNATEKLNLVVGAASGDEKLGSGAPVEPLILTSSPPTSARQMSSETLRSDVLDPFSAQHDRRAALRRANELLAKYFVVDVGYIIGVTDETIAKESGASVGLVAKLRSGIYGECVEGSGVILIRRALSGLKKEIKDLIDETVEKVSAIETAINDLDEQLEKAMKS